MIKYNLICECKETFESWFLSSSEYDSLKKRKLINCIYCNSTSVKKTVESDVKKKSVKEEKILKNSQRNK